MTFIINDTQHYSTLSVIVLNVAFIYCFAECHYAECRYAECHYAECRYAECRYAECRYAECRGAFLRVRLCVCVCVFVRCDGTSPCDTFEI